MSENADNIVVLDCDTRHQIPADRVLEGAVGELEIVVLCGWDWDGKLYFASSTPNDEKILWLLEKMKQRVLE